MRLMKLLSSDTAEVALLQQIVEQDPALTANLLRIANSAHYRGTQPVSTAHAAIVRMGSRGLYEISMGLALRRTIPDPLPGYGTSASAFTRHSVAVAVLSEQLARVTQAIGVDVAFTVGLLHDIGKLVVGVFLEQYPELLSQHLANDDVAFEEAEKKVLGTDHNEVGETIARRWNLPAEVVAGVRWHHAPRLAPDDASQRAAAVVHVADALAHLVGHGEDQGGLRHHIDSEAAEQLGVTPDDLDRIAADTLEAIDELAAALDSPR
jgi:putative nucleotidyltransferase with HDIG domain